MAIFRGPAWPAGAVPYRLRAVNGGTKAVLQDWVERFNRRLQRTVFVPYLPFHPSVAAQSFATITYDPQAPESNAGNIGCHGAGETAITVADESRLIHELLHVLGFRHEQLHPRYGWIRIPNDSNFNYMNPPAAGAVLAMPCTPQSWNLLLAAQFVPGPGATSGSQEWSTWTWAPSDGDAIDDPYHCDVWSGMMYPSASQAIRRMKTCVLQSGADSDWAHMRDHRQLLDFDLVSDWLGPVVIGRYNLTARDRGAVQARYRGHEQLGAQLSRRWKELTALDIRYKRSEELGAVDDALATCEFGRIRDAFNSWEGARARNPDEHRHSADRDRYGCVAVLRALMHDFV